MPEVRKPVPLTAQEAGVLATALLPVMGKLKLPDNADRDTIQDFKEVKKLHDDLYDRLFKHWMGG